VEIEVDLTVGKGHGGDLLFQICLCRDLLQVLFFLLFLNLFDAFFGSR
jgi:hypothetical protein